MRENVYSLLLFVFLMGILYGCFKIYDLSTYVKIDPNDHSMEPQYRNGNYYLDGSVTQASGLTAGRAVAFRVPGAAERMRVGWVVATEGRRVSVQDGKFAVDGKPSAAPVANVPEQFQEIVVPQGCVYVAASRPEEDSVTFGPLPMRNIVGHLRNAGQGD